MEVGVVVETGACDEHMRLRRWDRQERLLLVEEVLLSSVFSRHRERQGLRVEEVAHR